MATMTETQNPFNLTDVFERPLEQKLFDVVQKPLMRALGVRRLRRQYQEVHSDEPVEAGEFAQRALDKLGIRYAGDDERLNQIPKEGPLVFVANHPFGLAEGMVLTSVLRSIRPNVKFLASYMLTRFPEYEDIVIPVDPYGHRESTRSNVRGLRDAVNWVRSGGALVIFPSGTVSYYQPEQKKVVDPEWNPAMGRLISITKAPVVPIYFEGRNNLLFQLAGLVHPRFRSLLLPRNLLNKKGKTLRFRVGTTIQAKRLTRFEDDRAITDYLRFRTYLLGVKERSKPTARRAERDEEIVAPTPKRLLEYDIEALTPDRLLVTHKNFEVYHAGIREIPHVMREIGRLREVSFRDCGEGTGKKIDMDVFDEYYIQLFTWDRDKKEIVGAYRLCPVQETVAARGVDAVYSNEFFRYRPEFFKQIPNALELGRSFVQPAYQRHPAALFLLWRGISGYVAQHPQYHVLLGPVSISNDYRATSRQLIAQFLRSELYDHQLADLVRPANPYELESLGEADLDSVLPSIHDINEVSSWIADIDPEQHSVPVLLKHYLKLGGKIAGFNVDPDFADVLDALILVDFTKVEPRTLAKYMGKPETLQYLQHAAAEAAAA